MLRRNRLRCLNLIAVGLLLFPLPASAIERDISGSITGGLYAWPYFGQDFSHGYSYATGVGEIPHLGKTRLFGWLSYGWWDPIHTVSLPELVLTAANDDLIFADCGPTLIDEPAGKLSWQVTFVGGTGRFTGSTGTATLVLYLAPEYWVDGGYGFNYLLGEYHLVDATLDY